jgi:DNA-binding GntR family transcriptional regulator
MSGMSARSLVTLSDPPTGRTTQSRVADILRDRIISGGAPVGSRLRQVDVSDELGVSTTPVREAFRTLAAEGLVRIDDHRGVIVRELSLAECIETQELIALVESDNVRHAIPLMDDETLARAEAILRTMRGPVTVNDWIRHNRDFHLTIAGAAQRPRAYALLSELLNLSALHLLGDIERKPDRRHNAARDHEALVAAIRSGDVEAAARVAHGHCQPTLTLLYNRLAAATSSPPPSH